MSSELADLLVDARRSRTAFAFTPDAAPDDIAAAMRIQALVAKESGETVGGWKVGVAPDGTPVAGPIYSSLLRASGAKFPVGPTGAHGIEVEIAVRLARDLPRRNKPYDREDVLDACDAILAGIEIVTGRYAVPPKPPFLALLADNITNGGYVFGPDTQRSPSLDLSRLRSRLWVDGQLVHDGVGGHAMGDPLSPIVGYAGAPCDALGGLKAGHVVTTGTLSGCPYFKAPAKVVAEIEGLGTVEYSIES